MNKTEISIENISEIIIRKNENEKVHFGKWEERGFKQIAKYERLCGLYRN